MLRILLATSLILAVSLFSLTGTVLAQTQTVDPGVCVQVYGGGVVCGAKAPEHKPVEAGLAENIALISGGLLVASGVLLYFSRKARVSQVKGVS